MNKALTLIAVAIFVTGCASTDHNVPMAEQHQAAKTQYYDDLNARRDIEIVALNEEQVEQ